MMHQLLNLRNIFVIIFFHFLSCETIMDVSNVSTDVHTSTYLLQKLAKKESDMIEKLKKFVLSVEKQSKKLQNYRNKFQTNVNKKDDLETFAANPLNALGAMQRLSYGITHHFKPTMFDKKIAKEKQKILHFRQMFPTIKDFNETCFNLLLLQRMYKLDITELTKGRIKTTGAQSFYITDGAQEPLQCGQIRYMNKLVSDQGKKSLGIELKKEIEKQWSMSETKNCDQNKGSKVSSERIGNKKQAPSIPPVENIFKNVNIDYKSLKNIRNSKEYQKSLNMVRSSYDHLCSNSSSQKQSANLLSCAFKHHLDPYLRIGPFSIEARSQDPDAVVFHHFMNDEEMRHFINVGMEDITRSTMTSAVKSTQLHALARTSQQGWIGERFYRFPITESFQGWDRNGSFHMTTEINNQTTPDYPASNVQHHLVVEDKLVYNITRRIELATQLTLDRPYASEAYQVANYGLGGQYTPHPDAIGYHNEASITQKISDRYTRYYSLVGDRLATFMVYLSNVNFGGGTVFPLINSGNNVSKGSALFWKNMYSDGKTDYLSVHGGCPVLLGSKWITNKWIQYYDNFRTNPCGLVKEKRK